MLERSRAHLPEVPSTMGYAYKLHMPQMRFGIIKLGMGPPTFDQRQNRTSQPFAIRTFAETVITKKHSLFQST